MTNYLRHLCTALSITSPCLACGKPCVKHDTNGLCSDCQTRVKYFIAAQGHRLSPSPHRAARS
jgi:hypothetical protein